MDAFISGGTREERKKRKKERKEKRRRRRIITSSDSDSSDDANIQVYWGLLQKQQALAKLGEYLAKIQQYNGSVAKKDKKDEKVTGNTSLSKIKNSTVENQAQKEEEKVARETNEIKRVAEEQAEAQRVAKEKAEIEERERVERERAAKQQAEKAEREKISESSSSSSDSTKTVIDQTRKNIVDDVKRKLYPQAQGQTQKKKEELQKNIKKLVSGCQYQNRLIVIGVIDSYNAPPLNIKDKINKALEFAIECVHIVNSVKDLNILTEAEFNSYSIEAQRNYESVSRFKKFNDERSVFYSEKPEDIDLLKNVEYSRNITSINAKTADIVYKIAAKIFNAQEYEQIMINTKKANEDAVVVLIHYYYKNIEHRYQNIQEYVKKNKYNVGECIRNSQQCREYAVESTTYAKITQDFAQECENYYNKMGVVQYDNIQEKQEILNKLSEAGRLVEEAYRLAKEADRLAKEAEITALATQRNAYVLEQGSVHALLKRRNEKLEEQRKKMNVIKKYAETQITRHLDNLPKESDEGFGSSVKKFFGLSSAKPGEIKKIDEDMKAWQDCINTIKKWKEALDTLDRLDEDPTVGQDILEKAWQAVLTAQAESLKAHDDAKNKHNEVLRKKIGETISRH